MQDSDVFLMVGTILLTALATGALIAGLEHFEARNTSSTKLRTGLSGLLWPCLVIALVTVAISFPTLNSYFVGDDFGHIRLFHAMSLGDFLRLFYTDFSQGIWGYQAQELRPVIGLFWRVNYWLSGLHPLGYHLGSVLLHVLNSLLVFLIVRNVSSPDSWRAPFAGLLFAVLPLHSEALSWTSGSRADALPSLLYLATFLSFVRYRNTERTGYLFLSIAAFVGCLFSKEIAITLPVMLASYDFLQELLGNRDAGNGNIHAPKTNWRRLLVPYIPFVLVLLSYLALRRFAFTSFLKEDYWQLGPHVQEAVSTVPGFLHKIRGLLRILWSLQVTNASQVLLPFPPLGLGILFGFLLAWSLTLLRQGSAAARTAVFVAYFAVVWYSIANVPLILAYRTPRHLYLAAAGPCIAMAFLAFPERPLHEVWRVRFLCAIILISISGASLWKQNDHWIRAGKISERLRPAFAAAIESVPDESLIVASAPELLRPGPVGSEVFVWSWALPFALQEPFGPKDLDAQARLVELPKMYCCMEQWWEKTRLVLSRELSGPPEQRIEVYLLWWDEQRNHLRNIPRSVPRGVLRAHVTNELGMPLDAVASLNEEAGRRFVESLVRFLSEREPEQGIP